MVSESILSQKYPNGSGVNSLKPQEFTLLVRSSMATCGTLEVTWVLWTLALTILSSFGFETLCSTKRICTILETTITNGAKILIQTDSTIWPTSVIIMIMLELSAGEAIGMTKRSIIEPAMLWL